MELYKKLLKVKSKIGKISKDNNNPFFKSKYFDINALLEHVEPLLQEEGLLLLQPISNGAVSSIIYDVDSDGGKNYMSSSIPLPDLNDPQKIGSAITYYRRYTLQSLLGLQAEDDDGNKASGTQATKKEDDDKPWLNIYKKGTKDYTDAAKEVYTKMQSGDYMDINSIRNDYKVSKADQATIDSWFAQLKKVS